MSKTKPPLVSQEPVRPSSSPDDSDQTNRFDAVRTMLRGSVGKIPARLAFIFVLGIVLAAVIGVTLKLAIPERERFEWLPQRLEVQENAPVVDPAVLDGRWVTRSDTYEMTLRFYKQKFEWIIAMRDEGTARYYARGNFKVVGNVLILSQRADFGRPFERHNPSRTYVPFKMTNFNSYMVLDDRGMVWTVPVEEQRQFNLRRQPIFDGKTEAQLVWSRP